jgi:hypothetical protein
MSQMNPIEYQKAHPKEAHCHITLFDDGSVAHEPTSTECQQAVHPILISYQLKTDEQLLHLTRSDRSPNLFQLHCENPKVSLPTDINGMHTSVSGLTAAVKARVARHLKGYQFSRLGPPVTATGGALPMPGTSVLLMFQRKEPSPHCAISTVT